MTRTPPVQRSGVWRLRWPPPFAGRPLGLRWLAVSGLALAMGLLLSWLTYTRSNAVLDVALPLIDRDLPALWVISEMQGAAAESQQIAYEFYNSADRDQFRVRTAGQRRQAAPRLQQLRRAFTDGDGRVRVDRLQELQREAGRLFAALDHTFASRPVDMVQAHAIFEQISANASTRKSGLDALAGRVRAQAEQRGNATRAGIHSIVLLAAVFSALLLAATLTISYFLDAYLRGAGDRQRLVLFPERNPNPVISLDRAGAVTYANPGAIAMSTELQAASPALLLPDDLHMQLDQLRASHDDRLNWEYSRGARIIDISVHRLEDAGTFHVYLSDITERKQAEAQLEFQAFHDVLTSRPNRRAFEGRINEALASGLPGAVMLLGTDRFQSVIDTLGHAVADQVLCCIADRLAPLQGEGRDARCIHRFDGELFSILLPRIADAADATVFAARIAAEMTAPFVIDGREMFFSLSIGIASFPQDGTSVGELLRHADTALQAVRRSGAGAALVYTGSMSARALERLEVEHELRRAVERGELELHYQPQLEIASGRIVGVEALLRWRHPTRGLVSPADFISIAEETGAIVDIGSWTLTTACAQNQLWQAAGLPPLVMAVNISPRQFADPQLPAVVLRALHSCGLAAQWLELEVTEGAAMQDVDAAIATLNTFRALGVGLSIDDFGTGYSSLSYLKGFPIDKLKVDQSFVRNMAEDPRDAAIARSVIVLGHSLGLTVIAEGVETQAHLRLLGDYGCDQYQGYLCSRPQPATEIRAMLEAHCAIPFCAT